MFGYPEVLVPAKDLVNNSTIRRIEGEAVEYFHILLDSHDLIFAEGTIAESLFLSEQSLGSLSDLACNEIAVLFPEISNLGCKHLTGTSRPVLKSFEARAMAAA